MMKSAVRRVRDRILADTDKLMLLMDLFSDQDLIEIKAWRQALRDVPAGIKAETDSFNPNDYLPVPPAKLIQMKFFKHPSFIAAYLDHYDPSIRSVSVNAVSDTKTTATSTSQ